jgi:outer membrane receptor protein involved in Fe transport
VQWQTTPQLSIGIDALGIGGSYARGNENNQHRPDGNIYLGAGRSGGYGLFNLVADWQFARRWTLGAKLNNLFDRRYATASVLAATPFGSDGALQTQQAGSYVDADGNRSDVVRQSTFFAPGAPRAGFVTLRCEFD